MCVGVGSKIRRGGGVRGFGLDVEDVGVFLNLMCSFPCQGEFTQVEPVKHCRDTNVRAPHTKTRHTGLPAVVV